MKRTKLAASFLLAGTLLLTGCVSKKELVNLQTDYNKLKDEKTALDKSYQDAQIQLAEYRTQSKSLEDRLNEARKNNQELRNSYATLQGSLDKSLQQNSQGNINISKLVDEINASNRYIKQLVDTKSKSDSLNVVLTNNLTRSLSREELKEVDVKVLKGVVYISLADNMLYKSGSYEINERAGETLSKIAKIITDYKDYEVLVEGNTDNVPISRPNIRNNWDLSALRASSVVQALQNKDITIYGDGKQTRSFQYVDDLIEAMVRMMATGDDFTGPVNIGNPREFSMLELAQLVLKLTASKSKIVYQPLPYDDPRQRRPDITLAKEKLDWKPTVRLEEGLIEVINYFKQILSK